MARAADGCIGKMYTILAEREFFGCALKFGLVLSVFTYVEARADVLFDRTQSGDVECGNRTVVVGRKCVELFLLLSSGCRR